MEVGESIKKLREWRNFSQQYMADALNISQQNYSRYETGEIEFSVVKLQRIAEVLEVPVAHIFEMDEKAIFYKMDNVVHQGDGYNVGSMYTDPKLLDKLEKQYEARIADLKKELEYLKSILDRTLRS